MRFFPILCLIFLMLLPAYAATVSYTAINDFPLGLAPERLLLASDGNFYGECRFGGPSNSGCIFKVTATGAASVVITFNSFNGAYPNWLLQGTDGNLYGTTAEGGLAGNGTFFKLSLGGKFTTLANFEGCVPYGPVYEAADGNFYGAASLAIATGNIGDPIVFKCTPSGAITTFANVASLPESISLDLDPDGNFYGTTPRGGTGNAGTIFEITPNGTVSTLANFSSDGNESQPLCVVKSANGAFFGLSSLGGSSGLGSFFTFSDGMITQLVSFTGANGAQPVGGLYLGSDGNYYGVTDSGGTNNAGVVFKVSPAGSMTTYSFDSNIGGGISPLIVGSDGNLYGTDDSNGIFKFSPNGTISSLAQLDELNGYSPCSGLVQGSSGALYGVTLAGGTSGKGTIFSYTPGGGFQTVYTFPGGAGGASPSAGLTLANDGNFYGTTYLGGSENHGTLFSLSPVGAVTTLTSFTVATGIFPSATMIQGSDGNLYGTTQNGGAADEGAVFKYPLGGTLSAIASFDVSPDEGLQPYGGLCEISPGIFIGTTRAGGSDYFGEVYQVTSTGTLSTLVNFNNDNGGYPEATLTLAPNGTVYGTTSTGGTSPSSKFGTIFSYSSGTLNTLVSFSTGLGDTPLSTLLLAQDRNLYGTTSGDEFSESFLFKMTSSGTLTNLFGLNGAYGNKPQGNLVQLSDGCIYGTTASDTINYAGGVFRYNPSSIENVTFNSASTIPIFTNNYMILSGADGSALNVSLNYVPSPGDLLTVIRNVGSSAITGQFSNLPEGGTINATFNGVTYPLKGTYFGGCGNDLTLILEQTYTQWASRHSLTGGQTDMPQHDGVPNLLKFLYDINPTVPISAIDRAATATIGTTIISGQNYLTLTWRQNAAMTGVTVTPQSTSDLVNWTTAGPATQTGTDATTGDPIMQVQVPFSGQKEFLRLNVTSP